MFSFLKCQTLSMFLLNGPNDERNVGCWPLWEILYRDYAFDVIIFFSRSLLLTLSMFLSYFPSKNKTLPAMARLCLSSGRRLLMINIYAWSSDNEICISCIWIIHETYTLAFGLMVKSNSSVLKPDIMHATCEPSH